MSDKQVDPHKKQWEKLRDLNLSLTKEKNDWYDYRAKACISLLSQFC